MSRLAAYGIGIVALFAACGVAGWIDPGIFQALYGGIGGFFAVWLAREASSWPRPGAVEAIMIFGLVLLIFFAWPIISVALWVAMFREEPQP